MSSQGTCRNESNITSYIVKGGVTYRIITNQLGSPLKVIDTATGTIAQEMSYEVWGNVTVIQTLIFSLLDLQAGFTTEENRGEIGVRSLV